MVINVDKTGNVDKIFEVIELMEELRDILRKTAPLHLLNTHLHTLRQSFEPLHLFFHPSAKD